MSGPQANSLNAKLASLSLGGSFFVETTPDNYAGIQRRVSVKSRRPKNMAGMEFTCALYTAVGAARVGDIRYLVLVERTA